MENTNTSGKRGGRWQESDWGNLTFGRLLFYDVFSVEVHPTEWIR